MGEGKHTHITFYFSILIGLDHFSISLNRSSGCMWRAATPSDSSHDYDINSAVYWDNFTRSIIMLILYKLAEIQIGVSHGGQSTNREFPQV